MNAGLFGLALAQGANSAKIYQLSPITSIVTNAVGAALSSLAATVNSVAGQWTSVLELQGAGVLEFLSMASAVSTAKDFSLRITLDGTQVQSIGPLATTTANQGIVAAGSVIPGAAGGIAAFSGYPFTFGLKVECLCSISEAAAYQVWARYARMR